MSGFPGVRLKQLHTQHSYLPLHAEAPRITGLQAPHHIDVSEVPTLLLCAIVLSEDENFFRHHGFNFASMWLAFKEGLRTRSFLKGGSTITQQLIKNFFLHHRRTWGRKLREIYYAIRLERLLSKDQILSLYISHMEFGLQVYGVSEASAHYFKKAVEDLGLAECAFLAVILSKPLVYEKEFFEIKTLSKDLMARMGRILITLLYLFPDELPKLGTKPFRQRFLYQEFLKDAIAAPESLRQERLLQGQKMARRFTAEYLGHTHSQGL